MDKDFLFTEKGTKQVSSIIYKVNNGFELDNTEMDLLGIFFLTCPEALDIDGTLGEYFQKAAEYLNNQL